MALYIAPISPQTALEHESQRISTKKGHVLFERGQKSFGMFVVLRGRVSLDFGSDSGYTRSYGPGALVGLPSTLTKNSYSMTARVIEDSVLGFWSPQLLQQLLRKHPDYCRELLVMLRERMAENRTITAVGAKEPQPSQELYAA
jgi:CRP-like cAMP-binding protein